jgi:NTE family protein
LVLGGGGAAGLAHHVGTLLALDHDLGWKPDQADVIVGTSAGSIVGTLIRSGYTADDLAAWGAAAPPHPDREQHRVLLERGATAPSPVRLPPVEQVLPSPAAIWHTVRGRVGLTKAILSQLPFGMIDAGRALRNFGSLAGGWPERRLWLTAVDVRDAARVGFGLDSETADRLREIGVHARAGVAPLGSAVAASCAIPGLYRSVRIDGRRYVDGGSHSPTNADLLSAADIDTAIVISPMTGHVGRSSRRPDARLRRRFAAMLEQETATLARHGIETHCFEAGQTTLDAMGFNLLDRDRAPRVLAASFVGASEQFGTGLRDALQAETAPAAR